MDLLKNLAGGSSEKNPEQGYSQQSYGQQSSYEQQSYGQQQQPHSSSSGGWGDKLGGLIGSSHHQPPQQQHAPSSGSSGWGDKLGGLAASSQQPQHQQQSSGGWGDKLHGMIGGGPESEKKEDALDKGIFFSFHGSIDNLYNGHLRRGWLLAVDLFQEHILKKGPQNNESALEQAKDEQISDCKISPHLLCEAAFNVIFCL